MNNRNKNLVFHSASPPILHLFQNTSNCGGRPLLVFHPSTAEVIWCRRCVYIWILLRLLWLGFVVFFSPAQHTGHYCSPGMCAGCLMSSIVSTFTCKVSSCVCGSGIRAYEQLGYRAFGTPGKMAAGIAITLQNIGGEVTPPSVLMPGFWDGASHIMSPLNTSLSVFDLNECLCASWLQPCPVTCTSSSMSFLWSSRPFWKWTTLQGEEATHRINTLFIQMRCGGQEQVP